MKSEKAEKTGREIAAEILNEELNPTPPAPPVPPDPPTPPPANEPPKPPATPPAVIPPITPPGEKPPEKFDMTAIDIPPEVLGEPKDKVKKPDAPAPEPEPEEIEHADKKTRAAFATLRTQLTQAMDKLRAKEKAAIPAPEAPSPVMGQFMEARKQAEELQTKLNQAYDEIGRYSLAADPRFKAKYDLPRQALVEQIKDATKEWEIKDKTINEFLAATPKKRMDLVNEAVPDLWPVLAPIFTQYDHVERMKEMELSKHKETIQQLENDQTKQRTVMDQAGRMALFKQASAKILQGGHFVLKTVEGQDDWNKGVAVLHKRIQYLFSQDDPAAQAESLILGVAAPVYLSMFQKERARRIEAEKQLAERYKMKPGLDGKFVSEPPPKVDENGISAKEVVAGVLREEMGS